MQESLEKAKKACFMFRFNTFSLFECGLEEIFSPSAAAVILQMSANKCGRQTCKEIMRDISAKKEALAYLAYLKESMNWGKMSFRNVDFENGTGRIFVVGSFETVSRKSTQPCCHFLIGFLAGFLSELFAREVAVTEEQCAAAGGDLCEFAFK